MKSFAANCLWFILIACVFGIPSGWIAIVRSEEQTAREAPLPPNLAAQSMQTPDGFQVTVFAAEPDVHQPIGMCIDDRGRIWIAEAYSYPVHSKQAKRDRILILEDTDGDGRHDKRTVFYDKLNYVTGVEVGFGGAWVMSPPHMFFIPDRDGDDVPDTKPQIVLDGFGNHANAHNIANGFAWGPDGWLYGTHGRTNWSMIGKPGSDAADRRRFDGGVFRFHPITRIWEPYVDGCTNPWGIDWDDFGQAFIPNTVDPHLFHAIQGAHFEPWRNRQSSRFAYQRIATIADHLHFAGGGDVRAAIGSEEESILGGGHSHCGILVYLGGNWPEKYRNTVLMHNTHGRRINRDILKRQGSGYTASHGDDFMLSKDPWFMGVSLQTGPHGAVYASDWSDTGECHSTRNTRRSTGRVYRISYGDPEYRRVDVSANSDQELVQFQLHRNDWFVRHARRVLQERFAAGRDLSRVVGKLQEILAGHTDVTRRLRALWTLHCIGGASDSLLESLLDSESEHLRSWAIRLLIEDRKLSVAAMAKMSNMAHADPSQLVRLHLASALQRLRPERRVPILRALSAHAEDANDQNLPYMIWYAAEPLAQADTSALAALLTVSKIPLLQRNIARRIASLPDPRESLEILVKRLIDSDNAVRSQALEGIREGLRGRRNLKPPMSWSKLAASLESSPDLHQEFLAVSLLLNDPLAAKQLQALAVNASAPLTARTAALEQLIEFQPRELDRWLLSLLDDPVLSRTAIRGLARYRNRSTPQTLLGRFAKLDSASKSDALQTLASRPDWAAKLLDAVGDGIVPRRDLNAFTVRKIASHKDAALRLRVGELWGRLRATPKEKQDQIKRYKRILSGQHQTADRSAGRALFKKHCAACHKLFDDGGNRGPNITGAQRSSLDYLLENLVDPSASVARDYQMHVFELSNGRVLNGLVAGETETTITIQTINEDVVIPKNAVDRRSISPQSLMPEKLLDSLGKQDLRDLFAYLQGNSQPPLPAGQSSTPTIR